MKFSKSGKKTELMQSLGMKTIFLLKINSLAYVFIIIIIIGNYKVGFES